MILIIIALLVAVSLFCYSEPVSAKERHHPVTASLTKTVVNVEEGTLLGYLDHGIYTFLGIPYATARRFELPQKVAPWAGVRDATRPGEIFPQTPTNRIAVDEFFNPHRQLSASEHCQFLNIWTPSIAGEKKRPVMLWLHGGAFTDGSSIEPLYHGRNLSEKGDLVFVSLNHRLGAGGFLDLSTFGDPYRHSANSGIADLVAALEWIKTNIEVFGGDPGNVTILGQSGGGAKVLTLMATPAAKGLFHKAIVQSGAAPNLGMTLTDQTISRKVGQLTAEILGLSDQDINKIQELPYDVVAKAANDARERLFEVTGIRHAWGPVHNEYIPVHPVGSEFAEQSKDIPLLIGSVLNEFTTIVRYEAVELMMDNKKTWDEAKVVSKLKEKHGPKAEAVLHAFLKAYPGKIAADAYFADISFRRGVLETARKKADQNGAPVFTYMFTYESQVFDGVGMAWHCAEIPYVLGNAERIPSTGGGAEAKRLAELASSAWINFAYHGNPNHDPIPTWPPFSSEQGATMIMDSTWYVDYNHDQELMELFTDDDDLQEF